MTDPSIKIVSGLPRSGTSMMMRMLEIGGMKIVADNIRKADQNNPNGYYEFGKVKKIREDNSWLHNCRGKVLKIMSTSLYELPSQYQYKILFMQRKLPEIVQSQRRMLQGRKSASAAIPDKEISKLYTTHLSHLEKWLAWQDCICVLYVNYNDLFNNPLEQIQRVSNFLNRPLNIKKMMPVIDSSLYRNRC